MKILLTLFVLLFSSSVVADDISDFEIEGMSVGDSLLDYFSEEEIKNNKRNYIFQNNRFYAVGLGYTDDLFEIYDGFEIFLKTNDEKYKIYSIQGIIYFSTFYDCKKKKDEIVSELSKIFKEAKKTDYGTYNHLDDKSGKSKINSVYFDFKSGDSASVGCTDWSKEIETERNWHDNLRVTLDLKEYDYWVNNEAYK